MSLDIHHHICTAIFLTEEKYCFIIISLSEDKNRQGTWFSNRQDAHVFVQVEDRFTGWRASYVFI
jgi:hypothetical protein